MAGATPLPGNLCGLPFAHTVPGISHVAASLGVPPLQDHEVHLWLLRLDEPGLPQGQLVKCLDQSEQARVAKNPFAVPRSRFLARRAWLRILLGSYLGLPPRDVRFHYLPQGKPLVEPGQAQGLHFNVSDSQGLALYAIARRHVGVDLEGIRLFPAAANIVARYFSWAEQDLLSRYAATNSPDAFWYAWTFKEAYGKATGEGLAARLAERVPALPLDSPVSWTNWSARTWHPSKGFAATLVAEGTAWVPVGCSLQLDATTSGQPSP